MFDIDEVFSPYDLSDLDSETKRLRDYGFETRTDLSTGNRYADRLLAGTWTERNGFENVTSKRVHLMYLHLCGSSGQTVRDEIAGVGRSQAYEQMLELEWPDVRLEALIDEIDQEKVRRQALLRKKLPSGRLPLFRGVHCMSPVDETVEPSPLQEWAASVILKGLVDETVQLDEQSNEPTGYVLNVQPFTSTVDSWTCSYQGATYWSRTSLPGNEMCMVMAADVGHRGVVLWRNDSPAMDEILVLGGTGTVNVYFQAQIKEKATPDDVESCEPSTQCGKLASVVIL